MKKIAYKQMFENELTHPWYTATRALMSTMLKKNLKSNAKILDAGCGTGGTMVLLRKANFKNVTGIDNNKEAIKYCHRRKIKNVKLGNINKLPFKNQSFNAVICLDVLYHKNVNPHQAIGEFHRVLKKQGILYLQEPAYNWLRGSHDQAIETFRRFDQKEIVKILKSNHFKILKNSYFNTIFLLPIILKRVKESFSPKKRSSSDVHPLSKPFFLLSSIALYIESNIVKINSLPFGLSTIVLAKK